MGSSLITHRIGTAGWTIPAKPDRQGSHLFQYAQTLNCAEINSSFYRPHRPATWARWAAETPENFRFSVKAPKTITHEAKLVGCEALLTAFLEQLGPMEPKLGPLLFQLPPSLAFDVGVAVEFLAMLRSLYGGEVALEPRHASWFGPGADQLLESHGIARVAADPAKVPEAAMPSGDRRLVYYRLHGSPRMYYSSYEGGFLSELSGRIMDHPNAWVIFDNTAHGHAFGDALRLKELLKS